MHAGIVAFGIIMIVVILAFLIFTLIYLSRFFFDFNEEAEKKRWEDAQAALHDEGIIKEAKNHTLNYPEDFAKNIKKNNPDFDVDFNISLAGSIVKTDTVYADE